jgi:hypothetical protein
MSSVTERMSYEELNGTLKAWGADDTTLYTIHSYLNSKGYCSISFGEVNCIVERTSPTSGFYYLTLE